MKKLGIALALFASLFIQAKAQESDSLKSKTYLLVQAGAAYDYGEASFGKLISPAAQLAFGYRFNDMFGARLTLSGWQGRNYTSGSDILYKYYFIQPNLDFQFNFASLFKNGKAWIAKPYVFLGGGTAIGVGNKDAMDLANDGEKFSLLWEPAKLFIAGRAGIGADIRISDRLAVNLELNSNMYPDTFNSKKAVQGPTGPDFRWNLLAGISISFGGKAKKQDRKSERVSLRPDPVVNIQNIYRGANVDIFFDQNKAEIRPDQIKTIDRLVTFLHDYPDAKVQLDGYADRATGNSKYNQKLSEQRVATVRKYLVGHGIAASRISSAAHGDTIQPFEGDKNRAVTCRIR